MDTAKEFNHYMAHLIPFSFLSYPSDYKPPA